jgi:hypothetical protein
VTLQKEFAKVAMMRKKSAKLLDLITKDLVDPNNLLRAMAIKASLEISSKESNYTPLIFKHKNGSVYK